MQSSKSSGGGNILFMIIKIKCPTGENFEIMTFRCLKTLVFDKFLTKLQHYLFFYSWRILLVITNPLLYDYSTFPPIYTYPPFSSGTLTWTQKILEVSSDFSPNCSGGGWYHAWFWSFSIPLKTSENQKIFCFQGV